MAINWYTPKSPNRKSQWNDFDPLSKAMQSIRINDHFDLKYMLDNDLLDCDARMQKQGESLALIMVAVRENRYDCGKLFF